MAKAGYSRHLPGLNTLFGTVIAWIKAEDLCSQKHTRMENRKICNFGIFRSADFASILATPDDFSWLLQGWMGPSVLRNCNQLCTQSALLSIHGMLFWINAQFLICACILCVEQRLPGRLHDVCHSFMGVSIKGVKKSTNVRT